MSRDLPPGNHQNIPPPPRAPPLPRRPRPTHRRYPQAPILPIPASEEIQQIIRELNQVQGERLDAITITIDDGRAEGEE